MPMEVSYRHEETSMPTDPDVVIISPDATGKQHCGNEVERQLSHHDQCGETLEINDNNSKHDSKCVQFTKPMYMSTGNALPSQCNLTNTVPLPAASKPAILQFPMMRSMISAGQDAVSSVNANLMTTSASTSYNIIMSGSKTTAGLNNSTNAKMMTYQSPVTPITVDHAHHMASAIIDTSIVKTLSTNTSMAITVTDSNTVSVSNKCTDMVICREDNNVSDTPCAVNVLTCASTKTATISQPSMNPLSCRETSLPNTVTCAVEESPKAESFIDKSSPNICKLDSFDPPSCENSNQTSIPNSNLSPSLPRLKFAEQGAKQVQQRLRKLLALQKQPESWKEDIDSLKGIDSTLSVKSSDSACSVSTSTVKPQMNNSVSNDVIHSAMNNDVSSSWIHPSDNKNDSVSAIHLAVKDGVTTVHPTIGNVQLHFRKFPVQRIHVQSVSQKNEVDARKGACAALPVTASDSACSVVTGTVNPPMSNSVSSSAIHQPMKDGVTTGAVHPIMDNVRQRCRKLLAERIHVRSIMQKNEVDARKDTCAGLPVTSSDYACSVSTSIVDPPMSNSVSSSAIHQPMNIVKTTTVVSTMTPIMTTHSLRKSTASDVQLSPNTTMETAKTTNKVMPKISPKTSSHLGNTGMRCIDPRCLVKPYS
ncbi:platelet binding protein GspB-like [Ptychodera flava]|uniref:platelet binding protein GspB-like n=1 Tax=Ptychodera flava TaxID=63121 RepID=UPI00396AA2BA